MAPFNKRQIGYIKAIADVGGHTTYQHKELNPDPNLAKLTANTTHDGKGKYAFVSIGNCPQVYTSGSTNTMHAINTARPWFHQLSVYDITVNADQSAAGITERVTPECYLESVHARMRMIQELDVTDNTKSHQEYRMLVFRHKERQCSDERYAENFSNPLYDMFLATNNYKYGPLGYRDKSDISSSNDYAGATTVRNDIQSLMTNMVNKEDYVFMKDVRFYLGKEYGGKHIYEDVLHWDHADPIATEATDLTHNESNNKNYSWYVAIFCTTNAPGVVAEFPYLRIDTTTHVTSG